MGEALAPDAATLVWWGLLVFVLFLHHTHERLSERTRLRFNVTLDGKALGYTQTEILRAKADGNSVRSGDQICIGNHPIEIAYPKHEAFMATKFIWYGENDLGTIDLHRETGSIEIQSAPQAAQIEIQGLEFTQRLDRSGGAVLTVPTDDYVIEARWANHRQAQQVSVKRYEKATVRFAPTLGSLLIQSEPPGATVLNQGGQSVGVTPLSIDEYPVGTWTGELRLEGYLYQKIAVPVEANRTNASMTRMPNQGYTEAMSEARKAYQSGEFDRALEMTTAALQSQPGDASALALRKDAMIEGHYRRAALAVVQKNYANAVKEGESVLAIDPANARALDLVTVARKELREKFAAFWAWAAAWMTSFRSSFNRPSQPCK